jgi:outer membrane protein assembly factor BamB
MNHFHFGIAISLSLAVSPLFSSWPQWRGQDRNGIAAVSPPLRTEFPADGPMPVWESMEIPSDDDGGHSSVVVEGGRVFLSLVWHRDVPSDDRTIDSRVLRDLGYRKTDLPPEKVDAMEKARQGISPRLRGSKFDEWADQWIDWHLDGKEKLHYAAYIKARFKQGKLAMPLDLLDTVASKKDHVFKDNQELVAWANAQGWPEGLAQKVVDAVPATRQVATDTVLCLDAQDGKEVWRFEKLTEKATRNAASTPCVAQGRLFAVCSKHVYCLDVSDGKLVWERPLGTTGPATSPLYAEGKVFISDHSLTALDANTGETLWEQPKANNRLSSPVAWGKGDSLTLATQSGTDFLGINGNTGEIRWEASGGGEATAAFQGEFLAVQNKRSDSGLVVHRLVDGGIEKVWEYLYTSRRYSSSPLVYGNNVFLLGAGRHLCADFTTGEILWNKPAKSEISSPLLADGKILVLENNGTQLTMLDANAREYTELASTKIRALRCPSPAISDGFLYVRKADRISCFDLRKL